MYVFNTIRLLRQISFWACSLPMVAPQLWAQQTVEIVNVWRVNNYLRAESGKAAFGQTDNNSVWLLEKIPNNTAVRLKHVASGLYLHAETDAKIPSLGTVGPQWLSAMWQLEPVADTDGQVRLKNGWRGLYLHTEASALEMGAAPPGWLSARWTIKPQTATANPAGKEAVLGTTGGSSTFADQLSAASGQILWRVNVAGYLMKSTDSGQSWTLSDKKFAYVSGKGTANAWGVTFDDDVEYTADGGTTWATLPEKFKQVSAAEAGVVWGINQQLEIFRSANSGQTWEKVTGAAQGISAVSENVAWAVNQGNVWKTNDGGKTWSFSAGKMKSISAHDFYIAWGIDESGALRHTVDGKTWNKVADGYFYSCHTLNDYTAYAVDNNLKLVTMKYYGEEKAAAERPVATTAPAEEKKEKLTGNETIDALLQGKKAGEKSDTYGLLSIFNQSGYVASVALTYTEAGNPVTKNEQITLGFTKQYQLPIGATNIVLKVEGVACVDGLGMEVKFATAKDLQKCYKIWGTIFSTEWGGIACN